MRKRVTILGLTVFGFLLMVSSALGAGSPEALHRGPREQRQDTGRIWALQAGLYADDVGHPG
jgi:hypothetical protein